MKANLWDYNIYDAALYGGLLDVDVSHVYVVARYHLTEDKHGLRSANYLIDAQWQLVYSPDDELFEDAWFDSDDPALPWFVPLLDWED